MENQNFSQDQRTLISKCISIITEQKQIRSLISFSDAYIDKYETLVVELRGGLNGNGKWDHYLKDLANIITELAKVNINAWLIDMQSDCLDDVFQAYLGISSKQPDSTCVPYGFEFAEQERIEAEKFILEHKEKHGSCPHIYTLDCTSGKGVGIIVTCMECGEHKDVTDYSIW